jgi:hypothetical protein
MPKWPKPTTYVKKAQCPMKQKGHAMSKGLGNLGKNIDAFEKA